MLLAALSLVAGVGRGAIADSDEAFYAESAREMMESGDWLTPHFNYEPRFQKPALYYWLTAGAFLVTGPTEFSARLWSALAGLGLVVLVAWCGRRWFDDETGLLAGAIAATSFGYFSMARMSLPDLPLAFLVTAAIWATFLATLERERHPRRWLLVAAATAALGFLMKGPLALVLPVLVVGPTLLIERRSFNVRASDAVLAVVVFLSIATPWYGAMWSRHGYEYVYGFFVGDNYERFATARFNDPRPWWYYGPIVAGGLLPWTPIAIVWLKPLVQFLARRRDVGAVDVRLLLWALLPFAFFTLSVGKQPRYVLPVLPPLAILLASSIVTRTNEWRSRDGMRMRPGPNRAVVMGCAVGGLFLLTAGVLLYRARPLFVNVSEPFSIAVAVIIAAAGMAVVVVSLSRAWRLAPWGLALAAAVVFAVLPYGTLAAASDATVQQVARYVRDARREGDAIGTYKVFVRNLVFYTGLRHTDLIHDDHLVDWLGQHRDALIVLPAADADRLERDRGLKLQRLAVLSYFNDAALRARMLLWPNPAEDIERVVLVRVGG